MNTTLKRVAKSAIGGAYLGAGVAMKLAEFGLSASEVVLGGAKNLANQFVKGPDLNIGEQLLKDVKKQTAKLSAFLIKKGQSY